MEWGGAAREGGRHIRERQPGGSASMSSILDRVHCGSFLSLFEGCLKGVFIACLSADPPGAASSVRKHLTVCCSLDPPLPLTVDGLDHVLSSLNYRQVPPGSLMESANWVSRSSRMTPRSSQMTPESSQMTPGISPSIPQTTPKQPQTVPKRGL